MSKKLYRSKTNRKFLGVCGGIADYLDIDATVIRLLLVFAVIFAGVGLLAYFIAAFIMPVNPEE